MKVVPRTLMANEARMKKLAIALLTPYSFKNKLRTIQPQIFEKIKNCQPELNLPVLIKKSVISMAPVRLRSMQVSISTKKPLNVYSNARVKFRKRKIKRFT